MKLAVCLITADRYDYTKLTVDSFMDHNVRHIPNLMLLHADDASSDMRVRECARKAGFELACGTKFGKPRRGGQRMRHDVIDFAAQRGASHVLVLENDWESVRQLPMETIEGVFTNHDYVYCMRLYGRYKELDENGVGRRACGKTHYGKGKNTYDPKWMPLNGYSEDIEVGDIHWGAPPSVTHINAAVMLHDGTRSESDIRKKCAMMTELTARVVNNVFYHIGNDRTPGFKQ
ncbi:MAG: hypothetical protein AB7Q00_14565 [Phycisphaerales bacterium]